MSINANITQYLLSRLEEHPTKIDLIEKLIVEFSNIDALLLYNKINHYHEYSRMSTLLEIIAITENTRSLIQRIIDKEQYKLSPKKTDTILLFIMIYNQININRFFQDYVRELSEFLNRSRSEVYYYHKKSIIKYSKDTAFRKKADLLIKLFNV